MTLGEHSRSKTDATQRRAAVSSIIQHPSLDAAILKLVCQPEINPAISVISLADTVPTEGTKVRAAGWGWTYPDPRYIADTLQKIDIPVASVETCSAVDGLNVRAAEFCGGDGDREYSNVCHGDSGGPIMTVPDNSTTSQNQLELIGIVSRGVGGCPNSAHYAVFLKISAIHDWIRTSTEQSVNATCPEPETNGGVINLTDTSISGILQACAFILFTMFTLS